MYYATCRGCPRKALECPINRLYAANLPPGITSVRWSCPTRESFFPPGTRVVVALTPSTEDEPVHYPGTVMRYAPTGAVKQGKALIWLDVKTERGRQRVFMWPADLWRLDQPPVEVCPECGKPVNADDAPDWGCDTCSIPYIEQPVKV